MCRWTVLLGLMLAATGCMKQPEPAAVAMSRGTLEHNGLEREYFVFRPAGRPAGELLPAVIFMHGYGGSATGTEAEVTQGLNRYADEYGYVMVYPQATWFMSDTSDDAWEVSSWNHISDGFDRGPEGPICTPDAEKFPCPPECGSCGECGWASCNDDVGFLKDLVRAVIRDEKVDPGEVHVAGFSNGALMAQRVACEASELFGAVALIGGRLEPGFECTPKNPLPLLQVNGGADEVVPADGHASSSGYYYASTALTTWFWTDEAACATDAQPWELPVIADRPVQCTLACAGTQHPVIDCLWPDGDHRWPGTPGFRGSNGYCVTELQAASMPEQARCIAPDPDADIWGSRLLFEFFDRY